MVSFNKNYKAEHSEPENNFRTITEGEHTFIIEGSEEKTSKKGDTYINFQMTVLGGDCNGCKIWVIAMTSGEYEAGGDKKIANIAYATGVNNPKDSAEFNNIPFVGVVKHIKDKLSNEMKPAIVDFKRTVGQVASKRTDTVAIKKTTEQIVRQAINEEDAPF